MVQPPAYPNCDKLQRRRTESQRDTSSSSSSSHAQNHARISRGLFSCTPLWVAEGRGANDSHQHKYTSQSHSRSLDLRELRKGFFSAHRLGQESHTNRTRTQEGHASKLPGAERLCFCKSIVKQPHCGPRVVICGAPQLGVIQPDGCQSAFGSNKTVASRLALRHGEGQGLTF